MTNKKEQDVKTEDSDSSSESTDTNTQDTTGKEAVTNPVSEKVDKKVYNKVRDDLLGERKAYKAENADLKKQLAALESSEQTPQEDLGGMEERFAQVEFNSALATKRTSDPSFTDREEMVVGLSQDRGITLEQADTIVTSEMMKEVLRNQPQSNQPVAPNIINQKATQEGAAEFQSTGDPIKDMLENPNTPDVMRNALRNSDRF